MQDQVVLLEEQAIALAQRMSVAEEAIRKAIPPDLTINETIMLLSMIITDLSMRIATTPAIDLSEFEET